MALFGLRLLVRHVLALAAIASTLMSCIASDKVANNVLTLQMNEWLRVQACLPYSWKDYKIVVTDSMAGNNVLFEAVDEDQTNQGYKTDAMSMHIFPGSIPTDRVTALRSTAANSAVYAVGITSHDLVAQTYFVGVQCGPQPNAYRLRVKEIAGAFQLSTSSPLPSPLPPAVISAVLCPGQWNYHQLVVDHKYLNQSGALMPHVRMTVDTSDYVYALVHQDEPPLNLVSPYFLFGAGATNTLTKCGVTHQDQYFLGLKGYRQCADYTVTLEYFSDSQCKEEEAEQISAHHGLPELEVGQFTTHVGAANSVYDFYLNITEEHANDNLVVELEDMADDLSTDGLTLYMYHGSMPSDRATQFVVDSTSDKQYSLAVNLYDLVVGDYYVSVQVNHKPTSFRVIARLIHGELSDTGLVNGVVCPGELIYHYYNNTVESHADDNSENIRFQLMLHSGDLYYSTSHLHPSLKLVPPYRHVNYTLYSAAEFPFSSIDMCQLEHGLQYLTLQGGDECSEYTLELQRLDVGAPCEPFEHQCLEACEVLCDRLGLDHFHYASCEPYAWNDYMYTVTEENLEHSLIAQVDTLTSGGSRDFEALGLYMWYGELPSVRTSDNKNTYSSEQMWSLAVNSHDLVAGNYFFSVKCGPEPTKYRMLLELVPSLISEGEVTAGEVCPKEWVYHYVEDGNASSIHHARFTLTVHSGDVYFMTRSDNPPIKLIPPYQTVSYIDQLSNQGTTEVMMCSLGVGKHYLGLYGGSACSNYEVQVEMLDGSEACNGLEHDSTVEGTVEDSMTHLVPGHSIVGSCEPYSYTDYYLYVSEADARDNLVVELHDSLSSVHTEALEISLHFGAIPSDRASQRYSKFSSNHVYTVAVNAWDLQVGEYFVAVKCGPRAVSYRIVPELFAAQLTHGETVAGEVCPGEMVFHYVNVENQGQGHNSEHVEYNLKLYNGNIRYKIQHEEPALKMVAPYATAHSADHFAGNNTSIQTCAVDFGQWWITLRAIGSCSEYDLSVSLKPSTEECTEFAHDPLDATSVNEIRADQFAYESCTPNAYVDFLFTIDEQSSKNLIVEVEDLEDSMNPKALSLYLYNMSISEDRLSEFRSEYSNSKIWTLAISSHDITNNNFYASVKCGDQSRRFRLIYYLITAHLEEDVWVHAEVCPNDWVHHYMDVSAIQETGDWGANGTVSILFELDVHVGDLFFTVRPIEAPTRLTPPYQAISSAQSSSPVHTSFCFLENYPSVHKYYISMNGGSECAHYSVRANLVTTCDSQFHHDPAALKTQSYTSLALGKHAYGTCQPNSYLDFKLEVSDEMASNNLVFEVEDLSVNNNPSSLTLDLYELYDSIPSVREPTRQVSVARDKLYSLALDYTQLQGGTYFASVRCESAEVQFRIAANLVVAGMSDKQYSFGSVAPSEWTFHFVQHSGAKQHVRFHVTLYYGDVYMLLARKDDPPGFSIRQRNLYMQTWDEAVYDYVYIDVCDVSAKSYVALHGGSLTSQYAIYVEEYDDGDQSLFNHSIRLPSNEHSTCSKHVGTLSGYVALESRAHLVLRMNHWMFLVLVSANIFVW